MSLKYFRFYLSESKAYNEKELVEVLEWYRLIFGVRKDLGFIRASFDLVSTDNSISNLCESDGDIENEKKKWRIFLQKTIYVSKKASSMKCFIMKIDSKYVVRMVSIALMPIMTIMTIMIVTG